MAALGTTGAVKALVYDTVFKRAQDIAVSDKLRSVAFEGESLLKGRAECIGSSPSDVYMLSVSINGAAAVGECSCPAGKSAKSGLCKHVVALLLRRVEEVQRSQAIPSRSLTEELVIPIASQVDDIATNEAVRGSADGRQGLQATVARGTGPPASSSKRGLPPWMLGVVGSAAAQTESSNPPKSKKRAAAPKPPRPAPSPVKRARRIGHPLRISSDFDDGEEDPGEVEDAGPMEEDPTPAAVEDNEVAEPIIPASEGAAARERRRLRALKKQEVDVAAGPKGDEEVKRARGRPSRSVLKAEEERPARASRQRRRVKIVEEEDSDISEHEAAPVDILDTLGANKFGLTKDEVELFLEEHRESVKKAKEADDPGLKAQAEPVVEAKRPENSPKRKKPSSIFSMDNWMGRSSGGAGSGRGVSSLTADDLDMESLTNQSLGPTSQSSSQLDRPSLELEDAADDLLPSVQTTEAATTGLNNTPLPLAPESEGADDVANDMLDIFLGTTPSTRVAVKNAPVASSLPSSSQDYYNFNAAAVGLVAPTTTSSIRERFDVAPTMVAGRSNLDDLDVQSKPKKKSSLKDKVKMYLESS